MFIMSASSSLPCMAIHWGSLNMEISPIHAFLAIQLSVRHRIAVLSMK